VQEAKLYFSKLNSRVDNIGLQYVNGNKNRQDILELAYKWISTSQGISIKDYMNKHRRDKDAIELWNYWEGVIKWIERTFITYHEKAMKQVDWVKLYIKYKDTEFNPESLDKEINKLMADEEVKKKSGIYEYVLSDRPDKEKFLNLRAFSNTQKKSAYTNQNGKCPVCNEHFTIDEMEGDHKVPWSKGGKTSDDNLQMLCKECNRSKGAK